MRKGFILVRYRNTLIWLVLVAVVVQLHFESCARVRISLGDRSPSSTALRLNSNGSSYDGKPFPGEYQRRLPDLHCDANHSAPSGVLQIATNSMELKQDNC